MKERIAIAVSGGVDSLVAAFLLKRQFPGHDVFGIHFTTGYESRPVDLDALSCQLKMDIHIVDLSGPFEQEVIHYFTGTYLAGKTPNPCLICNRAIKFNALRNAAAQQGATGFATGHYARVAMDSQGITALYKGLDPLKEQSYFLSLLTRDQLSGVLFPLGGMTKSQVVALAREQHLTPPEKKESQDICFMNKTSVGDFITAQARDTVFAPGPIVTTEGKTVGTHRGLHCYTIGQRRGLNCPGPAPYYVTKLDMATHRLVVGFKEELLKQTFQVHSVNWLLPDPLESPLTAQTRIRYNHAGATARLTPMNNGRIQVDLNTPQYAVTPGQGAVFYINDRVIGAGIIQ